jgi:glycosyltransferase involved in cell wall biosynthesis
VKKLKKVCLTVTNDIATDQRVLKVSDFLYRKGFDVSITGRKKPDSPAFEHEVFHVSRFKLWFHKGFLFYAAYNIRLFFFLLFRKFDLLVANDLDTLLPNYLVSRIKRVPLVYDTHEYFTGSTELMHRPLVRKTWSRIERWIFPRLKHVFTVNQSIADLYEKEYGVKVRVVRNLPKRFVADNGITRQDIGWPEDKRIVLMQGGAINIDRGAEELIHAMKPTYGLENVLLYFIGSGDVWEEIQELTKKLHLTQTVKFIPRMPYQKLMQYTALADLGVSIDKPVSLNYQYSLPNKLFDYIGAGVPVLASPLVEVKNIVKGYNVGDCIESHDPEHIAEKIRFMFADQERYNTWRENAKKAAAELCWENEEKVLSEVYDKIRSAI